MIVYKTPGNVNTSETCRLAAARAARDGLSLVCATTEGASALALMAEMKKQGISSPLIVVTHAYGSRVPGENALKDEHRAALTSGGARLVTAAHVLSGVERGISTKFGGAYPAEIIAHSLRMLSHGVKVAVEIGSMALDAGAIEYGQDIVCACGTGSGLDTACVMRPAHARAIFETKIHELICMPY